MGQRIDQPAEARTKDWRLMVDEITRLGLIDEPDIELDKAALAIAALDHTEADLSSYLDLLDQIAERLHVRAPAASSAAEQAACLAQVLAGEFRFQGDQETYDDPANADLISVIDRRRGLPVALAILYVALARRLGWPADALNTPGHVLVRIGASTGLVIDPFHRGVSVQPEQLASLVRPARRPLDGVDRENVAPMTNRTVLVRLLMNQATRAERAREFARALTVVERITALAPAYSFAWWERARLERAVGDTIAARQSLTSMLETTRDQNLRAQVMIALDALAT
jgi:regulator of sirC expression with transglutaminase-like and TPR domain